MKLQLERALSLVAVGVLGALGSAHAAPVYEIQNLQDYDLKGTLEGTRSGYAMGVNDNNELVGIAQGRKKLSSDDVEGDIGDPDDGIADEEKITYSILEPIVANNFTFVAAENGAAGKWVPTFDSINGTINPSEPGSVNSVDSFYYGISNEGTKVGAMTAPQETVKYTGSDASTNTEQKFWFYRDYELRGVVKNAAGQELALVPPYVEYTSTKAGEENKKAYVGGASAATAINGNLLTGYASTGISSEGARQVQACLDNMGKEGALPLDICVQKEQYPTASGFRNIQYQTRAYVWQLADGKVAAANQLPLGLTPPSDSTLTYVAQGFSINGDGAVAGRSHVYRNGNEKNLRLDAAYWTRSSNGSYQYNWVPVVNVDDVFSSIAYSINDNGILVGHYSSYISGYPRDKFFYFDTKNPDSKVVVPNDFFSVMSDLSSRPKDINNQDQVVGNIETSQEKEKPRSKAAFLFDMHAKEGGEFSNLNNLLTCESKGFESVNGNWQRHQVEVVDANGKTLTYKSDIQVVEANSINEEGLIVGTALIRKPVYKVDDKGAPVVENGKLVFELDGNGNPVTAYLPRAVVLAPAEAGASACTVVDENTGGEKYERKGAATLVGLLLLPLIWLRRRIK